MLASPWFLVVLSLAFGPPPQVQPGQLVALKGQLHRVQDGELGPVVKSFDVRLLIVSGDPATGWDCWWLVEERLGEPRWSWKQRIGRCRMKSGSVSEGPAILASHDQNVARIPLRFPYLHRQVPLAPGDEWEAGELTYHVVGEERLGAIFTYRVEGSTDLGLREVLWVEAGTLLLRRWQEQLFLEPGVPHQLRVSVEQVGILSPADLQGLTRLYQRLLQLRGLEAQPPDRPGSTEPNPQKLSDAEALLKDLPHLSIGVEPERRILEEAIAELRKAQQQAAALQALQEKILHQPAPDFSLRDLSNQPIRLSSLRGRVVVLHFWEYAGPQLEAPYGEVGYLDFLHRKLRGKRVAVFGIAAHPGLFDAMQRQSVLKRVIDFTKFMNLSYPILLDEEGVLRRFGDPRTVGGKLPLYVVIDPSGILTAYHPGYWSSSPDEGLRELETTVVRLLPSDHP
jgi:peroxiredoxin